MLLQIILKIKEIAVIKRFTSAKRQITEIDLNIFLKIPNHIQLFLNFFVLVQQLSVCFVFINLKHSFFQSLKARLPFVKW